VVYYESLDGVGEVRLDLNLCPYRVVRLCSIVALVSRSSLKRPKRVSVFFQKALLRQ
jgi:hypothetical protein